MRALVQRVSEARVKVEDKVVGEIDHGFVVLFCAMAGDEKDDVSWMSKKLLSLRIMNDAAQKMNLSLLDVKGSVLLVSQFTLSASLKKGNRPSFTRAAQPEFAELMLQEFASLLELEVRVQKGIFGADMKVELINDGPVTVWLDSKDRQ